MSLQTLGFGHTRTSPLRLSQQFISPSMTVSSYPSPRFQKVIPVAADTLEDNKDVLIQRLSDLVQRLLTGHPLEDKVVSTLHREMDNIEILMIKADISQKTDNEMASKKGERPVSEGNSTFWRPKTPTRKVNIAKSESPLKTFPKKEEETMSPDIATKIAQEAEALATSLAKSITELQQRREEADRIHDLLVTRIEAGAERILFLEYHIAEMEDDYEASQSELQFLRIQLQAIQTQFNESLPQSRDEELEESIRNWKIDWEDIDRRSKARRKKGHDAMKSMDNQELSLKVS